MRNVQNQTCETGKRKRENRNMITRAWEFSARDKWHARSASYRFVRNETNERSPISCSRNQPYVCQGLHAYLLYEYVCPTLIFSGPSSFHGFFGRSPAALITVPHIAK